MMNNFDFSGLIQFLSITALLEKDMEPNSTQWDVLFETPGYKILIESEFKRDFLINCIRTAFKPSEKEKLEHMLNNRQKETRFIEHYVNVKKIRNKIPDFVEKINNCSMGEYIVNKVMEYFPSKDLDKLPMISFLVFDNDARGYTPVVVDIGFAMTVGESLPLLIAHEVHHFYRGKISSINYEEVNKADFNIIWTLNQIHMEGIADQIDKYVLFNEANPLKGMESSTKKYWEYVRQSPSIIKTMDNILSEILNLKDYVELSSELIRSVPMSGHPVGFYMAKTIHDEMGKDALIMDIGNPFAFFRRYNEAAKGINVGSPVFSIEAMSVIDRLESKYNSRM